MARLTNREVLEKFRFSLTDWNIPGCIIWYHDAKRFINEELDGWTVKGIGRLMYEHFLARGEIDEQPENRDEYRGLGPHYDFRLLVGVRKVFIETRLGVDHFDDPVVHVVNMHDA